MPALLPAFDRLVDAHSSISPRTRPGRRKGAASPISSSLAYSCMKISAAVIALSKIAPLAQAKQPKLSATPVRNKTPAPLEFREVRVDRPKPKGK
jgi:hypothetical protein